MPCFLLTGDRRALEVLREQADWIVRAWENKRNTVVRYPTFLLTSLLDAHEATGELKYLRTAALVAKDLSFKAGRKKEEGGIISFSRQAVSLWRFWQLNTPDAATGIDNDELKRRFAEGAAEHMKCEVPGCTPGYISAWAIAWETGLWPEETRLDFERKVLPVICFDRKAKRPLLLQYKIPFVRFVWNERAKTGKFVTFDPKEMAKKYFSNRYLYHFTCDYAEGGIHYTMPGYPHFVAVWKPYHEKYLKPRMDEHGVLEFTTSPEQDSR